MIKKSLNNQKLSFQIKQRLHGFRGVGKENGSIISFNSWNSGKIADWASDDQFLKQRKMEFQDRYKEIKRTWDRWNQKEGPKFYKFGKKVATAIDGYGGTFSYRQGQSK